MGLLDTDYIRNRFGSVLSSVYGDGQLIRVTMDRGPGGVMIPTEAAPIAIKVQVDRCTEAMRQVAGYTADDVRLLILQAGVTGPKPTSDDIIVARGERWKIYELYEDPARSYWGGRGVKEATEQEDGPENQD